MRTALLYENDNENENLSATRAWASGWLIYSQLNDDEDEKSYSPNSPISLSGNESEGFK